MEKASTKYHKRLLPSEIIELILLRLPVKPLGRFKSVSKTWNSIISNPRFIKTHTHTHLNHNTNKLIALSSTTSSLCSIELTLDNTHSDPVSAIATELTFISPSSRWNNILGSCNGLVLANDVNGRLYLMNPTTHHAWKLPKNPFMHDAYYGFSYDSSTDDYKVVSICFSPITDVTIYSVRNGSWRKLLTKAVPHSQPALCFGCALVNHKCHWYACSPSIIAFSFTDELFTEIRLPDSLQGEGDVVEIGGKLVVYSCVRDAAGVYGGYELWVMQEYGDAKSWTRVYSHGKYGRVPVCLVEGSDQDLVLQSRCEDGVVVFNIDERKCRTVRIIGGPSESISIGGTFVESIESIERISTNAQ